MTLILTLTGNAQSIAEGDLAFVVSQHENAITQVTQGINNLAIDHVAIMHRIGGEDGPLYAIEAYPRHGVCLTPIDSLLQRDGTGSVIFARVNNVDAHKSVTQALTHVGKPYDSYFMPDDNEIYCSELVEKCYVGTDGCKIFQTIPMSFHDSTGNITEYWTKHYAARGLEVPEGAPGTNPGQISRDANVTFLNIDNKQITQ